MTKARFILGVERSYYFLRTLSRKHHRPQSFLAPFSAVGSSVYRYEEAFERVFNCGWAETARRLFEAMFPVARPSLGVHHGHDPHAVRLFQVNNGVRKLTRQGTPSWRTQTEEPVGVTANLTYQTFDFVVKAVA
jgi:hypothetical protein